MRRRRTLGAWPTSAESAQSAIFGRTSFGCSFNSFILLLLPLTTFTFSPRFAERSA